MHVLYHPPRQVSQTLANVRMSDMGRSLSIDGVGVTLGTGTTMAFFHWDGTVPRDKEAFIMSVTGTLSSNAKVLMSPLGIRSCCRPDLDMREFPPHFTPRHCRCWVAGRKEGGELFSVQGRQ